MSRIRIHPIFDSRVTKNKDCSLYQPTEPRIYLDYGELRGRIDAEVRLAKVVNTGPVAEPTPLV